MGSNQMKPLTLLVVALAAIAFNPVRAEDTVPSCPSINDDKYRIRLWAMEMTNLNTIKGDLEKKYGTPQPQQKQKQLLQQLQEPSSTSKGGAPEFTPEALLAVLEDRFRAEFRFWIREEVLADLCQAGQKPYFPNTCAYYNDGKSKSVADAVLTDSLRDDFRGLPACYVYKKKPAPNQSGSDVGYYLSRLVMVVNEQKEPALLLAGLAENATIKEGCKNVADQHCMLYLTGALAQAVQTGFPSNSKQSARDGMQEVLWRLLYKLDQDGKCTAEFGINCADYVKNIESLQRKMGSLKALIDDLRALSSLYVEFKDKLKSNPATSADELRKWQNAVLKSAVEVFLDFGDIYRDVRNISLEPKALLAKEKDRLSLDAKAALAGVGKLIAEVKKEGRANDASRNEYLDQISKNIADVERNVGLSGGMRTDVEQVETKFVEAANRIYSDGEVARLKFAIETRLKNAKDYLKSIEDPGSDSAVTDRILSRPYYQLVSVMQVTTTLESGDYTGALKTVRHLMRCANGLDRKSVV
jgi:hypothetical protein